MPPGFTITTDACRRYMDSGWPAGLDAELDRHLSKLEAAMGRTLGDPDEPLLVSVRSGAKFSMPGMMDTILNLGLNDRSVKGLARSGGGERFAYCSYARLLSMYAKVVLDLDPAPFDEALELAKQDEGVSDDAELSAAAWKRLCRDHKRAIRESTRKPFPQDPRAQLHASVEAVFRSWNGARAVAYREREHISHDLGTAVNVQAMVFGNRDDDSGTGVAFTRDAATGENVPYGDFLLNAQGEDVVAGVRITEPLSALGDRFPVLHAELLDHMHAMEAHYRDMLDLEFTIEQGTLWMLQARVGKRTGAAALRMAVDMTTDAHIRLSRAEAVAAGHARAPRAGPAPAPGRHRPAGAHHRAGGLARRSGRRGRVQRRRRGGRRGPWRVGDPGAQGDQPRGHPRHARRVGHPHQPRRARQPRRGRGTRWGKPAIVGADAVKVVGREFRVGDTVVRHGDVISIDGSNGEVVLGAAPLRLPEPTPEFDTILSWADALRRGHLSVRANADNGPDAANARRLGAEGIGLCRTEHMFLHEDRLPVVRRMILARTDAEETDALDELRRVQHLDFLELLEEMDGLPVTVRLLDPPLHEFLPKVEELDLKEALGTITDDERRLRQAALDWSEQNPMLGIRGVRLAVMKPGLYAMQVRALLDAVRDRVAVGGKPIVEVMIPLTVSDDELALARSWVVPSSRGARHHQHPADRHHDRDTPGRAGRGPHGQGRRLLQLRHQRPDPDDVRVQPRRRRGQDDAGVRRPGAAARRPLRLDRRRRRGRAGPSGGGSAAAR